MGNDGHHFLSEGEMRKNGLIQDRTWMFTKWREVFVGQDVVSFMVNNGLAADAEAAVAKGQKLLEEGKIYYVGVKYFPKLNRFKNTFLFYRWTGSEYWLSDDYVKSDKKGKNMKIDNYKIPKHATTIQLFDTSDDFIPTEVEIENLFSEYNTVIFCVRRPG